MEINFLKSSFAYQKGFLDYLYKGDDNALNEIFQKICATSKDALDKFIEVCLYEGAIRGYFDDKKAHQDLESWLEKGTVQSIEKIASVICKVEKPSKAKIVSVEASNYHWTLSFNYFTEKKYDESLNNALVAVKANPNNSISRKKIVDLFIKKGDLDWLDDPTTEYHIESNTKAVEYYRHAHAIDPERFGVHISRTLKHYLKINEIDQAIIFYKFIYLSSNNGKSEEELNLITKNEWGQLCKLLKAPRKKVLKAEILLDQLIVNRDSRITDLTLASACAIRYIELDHYEKHSNQK